MTFGEKLQKLRTQRSLSQDALAEALDVSRQAVSRWERDETLPETEKVIRLSRYFAVTTDYLLLEEIPSPRQQPALIRLHAWWADRSWLLGVGLAAVGLWLLLGLTRGDSPAFVREYMERGLSWTQTVSLLLYGVREYTAGAAALALAGVLTTILGRRRLGALRWYHAGWTVFFWGVGDLLALTGVVLWFLQAMEMWEDVPRQAWFAVRDEVPFALGMVLLGLALALLGPKLDPPRPQEAAAPVDSK